MKTNNYLLVKALFALFFYSLFGIIWDVYANDAQDWNQFHGPKRDRISSESNWLSNWDENPPKQLWRQTIGIGFSSISVVGNRVYTMGNQDDKDTVWCFDANTGQEIWRHTYSCELFPKMHEGGPGGTPTVDADAVFTVSKDGQMFCLNAFNGEVNWSKNLQKEFGAEMPTWRFALSPLLENDMVILDIGLAVALHKKTGEVIWKSHNYESAYSSPIAFDFQEKRYIAIFPKFGLVLLDAENGKEFGKYKWDTRYGCNAATPIFHENKFFVSSGYGRGGSVIALNDNGELKEVWYNRLMRNHMNSCVLWNGFLYGFD
ncbi:MAG: PQQ-like beta-propeller repeat protein [Candidatus Omnitrophica bacterium]|nr:PQQ-like beta-propeller repeat protein [Candidatus Omnitrophota bacterium]